MKKRILSLLTLACILLGSIPLSLSASAVGNDIFVYEITDGKVKITGCIPPETGELIIPSEIDGCPVTEIAKDAFGAWTWLESVVIPGSITKIYIDAFYRCELESIVVAEGNPVYHSENNCIIETETNVLVLGCKNSVIPDYVTEIGACAFDGCKGLTSGVIPEGVSKIQVYAFSEGVHLTEVVIPGNVTEIEHCAFQFCEKIKEIVIPEGVVIIGNDVFQNCYALESISFPKSAMLIGYDGNPCGGCSSLKTVKVAEGNPKYRVENNCLIIIENNKMLLGCANSVIPDGVVSLDNSFKGCSRLKSIAIPKNVTDVNEIAFYECFGLMTVYCEAESQPEGWKYWLYYAGDYGFAVYWGCSAESVKPLVDAQMNTAGLVEEKYTSESWAKLQTVIEEVKNFDPKDKTEDEIQEMADKLNNAVLGLEKNPRLLGDVNGDKKINSRDYVALKRYCFKNLELDEDAIQAANVNGDNAINSRDYVLLKRHCFKTYTITPEYVS